MSVAERNAASPAISWKAWYVVGVLTLVSTVSFIDRQILAIMIGPVKRDLGLSDTEVSLLIGLAFAFFYSLMAIPMGILADRIDRRRLIFIGMVFWSAMTAFSGMAQTTLHMFLARMGVGIGEATVGPAAASLLSDKFDRSRLPLAMTVFSSAPFIGVGLANILGGLLVSSLMTTPTISVPLIGETRSWQAVFFIVGLPGILLAFLVFTFAEPARSGLQPRKLDRFPLREALAYMRLHPRFFALHFAALLALATIGFGLFAWVVEFLVRLHGLTRAGAGLSYGLIALVFGIGGSVAAGLIAGQLTRGGRSDANLRIILLAALIIAPLAIAMPLVPSAALAILLLCPITFMMGFPAGLGLAALNSATPAHLRGQMTAIYLFVVNFLSYTFGPLLIALLTDHVFRSEAMTHYSIATLAALLYPLAALSVWLALPHYRRILEEQH